MQSISHFEKILLLWPELKRFKLIPEIEMFSHSTPIIPRAHFRSRVKKFGDHLGPCLSRLWGSFGVGDHFGSCESEKNEHCQILNLASAIWSL